MFLLTWIDTLIDTFIDTMKYVFRHIALTTNVVPNDRLTLKVAPEYTYLLLGMIVSLEVWDVFGMVVAQGPFCRCHRFFVKKKYVF